LALYIGCPRKPPQTLYDAMGVIAPPEKPPKKPKRGACDIALARYRRGLAEFNALVAKQKAKVMKPIDRMFYCGDGVPEETYCGCGHSAELLCDFPTDAGTCDKPICWCCSRRVGEDRDHCNAHYGLRLVK
jgi:hypothetical protein